jgi:hypothetical protein
VWPNSTPVWPVFNGTATLRDFAATVEPAKVARWAELSALLAISGEVHPSKYYDRYMLDLRVAESITAAFESGQYCIQSKATTVDPGDWQTMRARWNEGVIERVEAPIEHLASNDWEVVQTWDDVTVRCTDAALSACPTAALSKIVECPQIPVRPPALVITKRLFSLQVTLTRSDAFIVVPWWLSMPPRLAGWIEWAFRKMYWPSP